MFQAALSRIQEEFKEHLAYEFVSRIASFHRIQASPGFRETAGYVCSTLQRFGIQSCIHSFQASEGTRWWSEPGFQEWVCEDAELVLLDGPKPERLCSFLEDKLSVIQRSSSTPPQGIKTSIVYIERGEDPSSYENIDVRGKIVFSRGDAQAIARIAVVEKGALGIVVDNMNEFPPVRERFDMLDARQYTSFWPLSERQSLGLGFVLTPRQGEKLRKRFSELAASPKEQGSPEIPAFARVISRFYDGQIEVVDAVIAGESEEEVVGIAHLCHPQPSANDNASGSGTLMEAARTLWALISTGRLPRPKRGIRFLFVPEMTGSYAYLCQNDEKIPRFLAAINLDMVGENQDLCKSAFLVEKPPRATPGFGGDVAEAILRHLAQESKNLAGTSQYALFKWAITPFSGGSDHYIWADPSVGVTCPMLIQWPDRYYHTNQDTPDKVDPRMLKLAGTLTATYLYFLANAGQKEALWLLYEMASHFSFELDSAVRQALLRYTGTDASTGKQHAEQAHTTAEGAPVLAGSQGGQPSQQDTEQLNAEQLERIARARRALEKTVAFQKDRKIADLSSLWRMAESGEAFQVALAGVTNHIEKVAQFYTEKALRDLAAFCGLPGPEALPPAQNDPETEGELKAKSTIPARMFKGPVSARALRSQGEDAESDWDTFQKKWRDKLRILPYILYWADGKRTLGEIASLVEGETGERDMDLFLEYIEILKKHGIVQVIMPDHSMK